MEELLITLLIVFGGFSENIKNPPKELSTLTSPKLILKQLKISPDEQSLISVLETNLDNKTVNQSEIKQAIKDIGDSSAAKRQSGRNLLTKVGFAAVPYLEKAIESKDPEIRLTAKEILAEINSKEKAENKGNTLYVKKLMAIKALQEMKSKNALPVLKKLVCSNVQRTLVNAGNEAILSIEGKEAELPNIDETVKDIATRLPDNISSAGIMRLNNKEKPLDIIDFLKKKKNEKAKIMSMLPPDAINELENRFPEAIKELLLSTGNIRIDAIAAMISSDLGQTRDSGFMGFIFKGECEPSMLETALASDFRKSFKFKNKTVYFSYDFAICLLDSKTLIIAISDANNGQQIIPLLKSFTSKKKQFSEKVFADKFPIIAHGLKDVIAGKDIIGIGGAASETQRGMAIKEFSRDIDYCKRRLTRHQSVETKLELNFLESIISVFAARQFSGKITDEGKIKIDITCETKKAAEKLTKSVKEMEKALRETLVEVKKHARREIDIIDPEMLDKPLFQFENKGNTVQLNADTEITSIFIMCFTMAVHF